MQKTPALEKFSHIALGLRPTSVAPYRRILPDRVVVGHLKSAGYSWRDRVYNPLIVFLAMIIQALDEDYSCNYAVANVLEWLQARKAPGQRRNRAVPKASSGLEPAAGLRGAPLYQTILPYLILASTVHCSITSYTYS